MNTLISDFLKSLEGKLSDLHAEEKNNVLSYYEEYLCDAEDSGKNIKEVIQNLGSADSIAAQTKAEVHINQAQKNPGLKNFNRAMKNIFYGAATPFSYIFRSIFLIVVYGLLVTFMGGAIISFAAALAFPAALVFEALRLRTSYIAELIGSIGAALLSFGLLALIGFALYWVGKFFANSATRMLGWILKRNIRQKAVQKADISKKERKPKYLLTASLAALAAGLIMFFASGLPVKYFVIFNSMKPGNIKTASMEYNPSEISNINILTAHSCIKLERGPKGQNKIIVTYEQPDWLFYQISSKDGVLAFSEEGNGRLPLFDIVTLHESRTQITVSIPEGYDPVNINLQSKGGFIDIRDTNSNIKAKTYTGRISLHENETVKLDAKTEVGTIEVDGRPVGEKNKAGLTYISGSDSKIAVELYTSRGQIIIE